MKRIFAALLAAALLTGCAGGKKKLDVQLMEGANPENSAVTLYVYDGEQTAVSYVFDDRESLIDAVNSAKVYEAPETDLSAVTGTLYGISCYGNEQELGGTWVDGLWVSTDGAVYRTDLDLAGLIAGAKTGESMTFDGAVTPGICWFARYGGEWHTQFLTKAAELSPRGLELAISPIEDGRIKATLTDTTGEEQCCGKYYALQVCLDGVWYEIPTETELVFEDIAYIVPPNGSVDMTYYVEPYGELPAGLYRVAAEGAAAEFSL